MRKKKCFTLPKKGRKFGGVAMAMANYTGIDVTFIRIVWVFLLLPGGWPGLVPYLIIWIVAPDEE